MKKTLLILGSILAFILIGLVIASFLIDEPLRRYAERKLNASLTGFTAHIRKLTTHPLALSMDIDGVTIVQNDHPEPPVVLLPRLHGGLQWRALLTLQIVADIQVDDPKVMINWANLDPVLQKMKQAPAAKVVWQDKLTRMAPFTVSEFRIENGQVTYRERTGADELSIGRITLLARTIRNVYPPAGELPTGLIFEAVVPGGGRVRMRGSANLLQKPLLSLKADADLHGLDLARFKDLAQAAHVVITKGIVDGAVRMEMTPERKVFILKDLVLKAPHMDYLYTEIPLPEEVKKEKKAETAAKAQKLEREVVNKPGLLIKAEKVRINGGTLGIVNRTAKPAYRVFMEDLDVELQNISNHFDEGEGRLFVKGRFMGSGETSASGTFRPEKEGPDFTIRIAIKDTKMRSMNDLFRAYGNFDVSEGFFSFYSELTVVRSKVDGYVKPLFRDIKVYDKRTDKEKGEFHKLYERIVGGVAKLLENRPRNAVATQTPVKGTLGSPKTSTWTALVNILRNAFFQAILPGFEQNITK